MRNLVGYDGYAHVIVLHEVDGCSIYEQRWYHEINPLVLFGRGDFCVIRNWVKHIAEGVKEK